MKDLIIPVIAAALGSSALFSFIQFLISRKDNQASTLKRIENSITGLRQDNIRTQLLLMISDYPQNIEEIFKLAEEYFVKLEGNWYMSAVFNKWLQSQGLPKPDWYKH